MWDFPTSVRRLRAGGAVLLALVCVGAGLAGGYVLRAATAPAPAPATSVLSITAAGTLATVFPQVGNALANLTPGVAVPGAAQQYQGSLAALDAIAQLHEPFDVAAAADFRLIPSLLEPDEASWEVVFATTPEVLCYDPSVGAFAGINSTNWAGRLVEPGVVLGVANQSTDPNGYNGIFVLELEGQRTLGSLDALYGHFYTTPVGALAEPSPATTRVEPETQVATLLSTHAVSAFITYRAYALSHGLAYVALDPGVDLGSTAPGDLAAYAAARTTILGPGGPTVVTGAPVLFAATVPPTAPDPALGVEFLHLLLSATGSALLTTDGFSPVLPGWTDRPAALPVPLLPDVEPLPPGLTGLLA
jgi:molybdate/tungstate transport system substrate-binding protein